MRKLLVPLVAAGSLLAATFAYAETVTGLVAEYDSEARLLVLEDGMAFALPESLALPELAPGAEVVVDYQMNEDDGNVAESVTLAE